MLSILVIFRLNLTEKYKYIFLSLRIPIRSSLDSMCLNLFLTLTHFLICLLILQMFQLNISSKTQHGTCVLMLSFNLSLQTNKSKKNSKYTHCVAYSDLCWTTTPSPWVIQERETSKLGEKGGHGGKREQTRWTKRDIRYRHITTAPLSWKPCVIQERKTSERGWWERKGGGNGRGKKKHMPKPFRNIFTFTSVQNHHPKSGTATPPPWVVQERKTIKPGWERWARRETGTARAIQSQTYFF